MIAPNTLAVPDQGVAAPAPEGLNANPDQRPAEGEVTGRQDGMQFFGGSLGANGSVDGNPCGFPGYGSLYYGSYATYRFMLDHPKIRHVRHQVMAPILSNVWAWEARKGTPEPWVEFAKNYFPPLRLAAYTEGLRALDYGHYKFEQVWAVEEGRYVVTKLKPLAVDTTSIYVDTTGEFAGLGWGGSSDKVLDRRKSFLYTYDGEAGELYGRSRLENIRTTAWRDWLDCATQIMWLAYKICGKLAIITTPSGMYKGANGELKSWRDAAAAVGKALASPQSSGAVWFPTAALPDNASKENLDLLKIALVNIDVKDFGNHAPALEGLLARMRYDEEGMSAGYLRSPRTNMESEHGSRADSEQHTDTETIDCELLDLWFAEAFRTQVIDNVMTLNFGNKAKGAIRCVPAKLRDSNKEADYLIINGIMADPEIRPQYLEQIDQTAIAKRRGYPIEKDGTIDLEAPEPGEEQDVPPERGGPPPSKEPKE